MKIKCILVTLLSLMLVLSFAACDTADDLSDDLSDDPSEETTVTPDVTETPTEEPTADVTEDVTDQADDESRSPVDSAKKYREDWEIDDPNNPFCNLIPVGTSYDGKTTCYDGRYDFGFTVCKTSDGVSFSSMQEAVWHLEEIGGGSIRMADDTDVCLYIEMPDDNVDYRLYYDFRNCDFVFNRGQIYDDCTPNAEGVNGYGYYANLFILDVIKGLQGTYIWVVQNDDFSEAGRYLIGTGSNDDPNYEYLYQYIRKADLNEWPGLPEGEHLPEN